MKVTIKFLSILIFALVISCDNDLDKDLVHESNKKTLFNKFLFDNSLNNVKTIIYKDKKYKLDFNLYDLKELEELISIYDNATTYLEDNSHKLYLDISDFKKNEILQKNLNNLESNQIIKAPGDVWVAADIVNNKNKTYTYPFKKIKGGRGITIKKIGVKFLNKNNKGQLTRWIKRISVFNSSHNADKRYRVKITNDALGRPTANFGQTQWTAPFLNFRLSKSQNNNFFASRGKYASAFNRRFIINVNRS